MPPKKQAQLQSTIETQEEWDELVSKEGLSVIDVYSAWCGPCKAVQGLFRRLKNELGDDLLRFAMAKSDTIDSLQSYRERSIPTFLMYSCGSLVSVVRGALGPLLEKNIKEQLSYEHEVLEGKRERVSIADEGLGSPEVVLEDEEKEEEEEEEEQRPEPTHKQITVMVIKPDAVQAGKVDDILERVKSEGLEVLAIEEHQFTKEEAIQFYKQHEGSDHFEALVDFMCSGPCMTLVLTKGDTGEGVVDKIRELIGPTDVEQAKETAPESIRATYGTDSKQNAVHASDSREVAARELAFFMPKFRVPYVPGTEPPIERTLALIRPDALAQHKDSILDKIKEAGFDIALQKELTLTKEQAGEFYKEHEGKDFYDSLTTHMSSGPMLALCLAREDAVAEWRKLLTSEQPEENQEGEEQEEENLRRKFSVEGSDMNPLHGSDAKETAAAELDYFFPTEHTFCAIKPHVENRDAIVAKIQESGFHVSMTEERTLSKEMAEQLYDSQRDKDYFDDLVAMMTSGSSLFMVLSKPDAVMGWRAVMGPTDPEQAKDSNPNTLRALFGSSMLENALHGSSNSEHASHEIEQVFGPVSVLPDGTIQHATPPAAATDEEAPEPQS